MAVHLRRRALPALLALACLVPFDTLGYERYEGSPACDDCHPGFKNRGALHGVHQGGSRMTNTCNLCHVSTGDNPRTYTSGATGGQGCRGCHGVDNGTTYGWGAGLRAHHANAGVPADANGLYCADCHGSDPPVSSESTAPPYYARADVFVKSPCTTSYLNGGEDWTGDDVGLDNDGDLHYDGEDSDCAASPVDASSWGRLKTIYR